MMRFGVNVPNFGPGTSPAVVERWAQVVEGLGYDLLMVSDHVAVTPDVAVRYPAPFYEPFTTLAYLAGVTRRIQLGTTVLIVPYRHPLVTARMAGNLDALSGGRLVLGVGVGWARQEFAALDVPFAERGAITDDYLAALAAYFDTDTAGYDGRYVSFSDVSTGPRTAGGPPLWVGGASTAALRRTVRFGTAWHPLHLSLEELRTGRDRIGALAAEAGRPAPELAPRIMLSIQGDTVDDEDRPLGVGSLAQVRDDLATLRELGASTVVLDPYRGDPSQTLRPETMWRALAALRVSE